MRAHLLEKDKLELGGGGDNVLKIVSISYMCNTTFDHFGPKIKPHIYGNRNSNAK